MLLNLLINYYVLKELVCQDKYQKIELKSVTQKCQICQHCQLRVIKEKLEYCKIYFVTDDLVPKSDDEPKLGRLCR